MEWKDYWSHLISENKLMGKVEGIKEVDKDKNSKHQIEEICYNIYKDYEGYKSRLKKIKNDLLDIIEKFPGVHLQTSRIKELDSLLCKVINKKYDHMLDDKNPYSAITSDNYKDVITDLIGIRLIISYRGNWIDLHNKIIEVFPYAGDEETYDASGFVPHQRENVLAEIPIVYHAYGDDLSMYQGLRVNTKIKDNGYRSVHYVVSFEDVYVEIQIRTIYDEAWNDCDHNYVYKKEHRKSYSALKELSKILSLLTNASNDLGNQMQEIYEEDAIEDRGGKYVIKQDFDLKLADVSDKIKSTVNLLKQFSENIE